MSIFFIIGKWALITLFAIFILLIIIINTKIRIKIDGFNKDSINIKNNSKARLYMQVVIFNKLKIFSKKLDREKMKKSLKDTDVIKDRVNIMGIGISKINLESVKINLEIGTEDIFITTYLIPIISSIISTILVWKKCTNSDYVVSPMYNKNAYRIAFECIISMKLVHIIHIIYILVKGEMKNGGATSNRRTYDHSYE